MKTLAVYIVALAAAETVFARASAASGILLHAGIVLALFGHRLLLPKSPLQRVLLVLVLLPLLRIIGAALVTPLIPALAWHGLAGVVVLAGAIVTARRLEFTRESLGLQRRFPRLQGLMALSGLPLSLAAYAILRPPPVAADASWLALLIGLPGLLVLAAWLEEVIFRGLLREAICDAQGDAASIVLSSVLFACMYISSQSALFVVFNGLVGLAFAYCVHRTRSLEGVALAHSLMNTGLFLVWPALFKGSG